MKQFQIAVVSKDGQKWEAEICFDPAELAADMLAAIEDGGDFPQVVLSRTEKNPFQHSVHGKAVSMFKQIDFLFKFIAKKETRHASTRS